MAVIAASARYGTAVYGVSEYGVVDISATLSGVEGTGAVGTPEPRPSEPVDSVSATGQVNTVQINLTEKVDGVEATGTIGVLEHSNTKTLTGVEGTGEIESVVAGGFEIDITERIDSGVEATGQVGSPTQIKVGAGATGVSATGSIGTLEHSNTTLLQSVVGTVPEPSIEPQITEVISGVFATGAVNDNFTFSNSTVLTSVEATGVAGQTTETGVLFDFQAVREQYSRFRTVRIPRAA
tara:strand:+ start:2090 stop:2803 length:714 start_codon:yes stop_codon:yes gene_type:complete